MINKVIRKVKIVLEGLYVSWGILKFRILFKNRERFKKYRTKIFGHIVYFKDPLSLYYELKYIFKDQIYYFNTDNSQPFIIDGGAFIGISIIYFKKKYPKSTILAFEPDKGAIEILRKNIKINKLANISIKEAGLSDSNTTLKFTPDNTDGGRVDKSGSVTIPAEKLSKYITKPVDFLKLNIEGSEAVVIKDLDQSGKLKMIKEMCIEWHSFSGESQNLATMLEPLERNGFRYYISSFRGTARGKFLAGKDSQFYLIVYAKNHN